MLEVYLRTSPTGGRTTAQGYGVGDGVRQQFTQKERDVETGLDYFGARYYGSVQGRFTSADPVGPNPSRQIDPQQLNRYSLTRNNPLKYTDPDGRDLKIDPKLKEPDIDKVIAVATKANVTKPGHDLLLRMKESKMSFVFTVGNASGPGIDAFGSTDLAPFGREDAQGRTIEVDPAKSTVTITIDFAAIAANNKDQTKEEVLPEEVFDHELGHAKSALEDPVKYSNDAKPGNPALRELQELKADEGKKAIAAAGVDTERYPDPESYGRATDDTRALFGLPKKAPDPKKPEDQN